MPMFHRTHYTECPGCKISDALCYYIDAEGNEHINNFLRNNYDKLLEEFHSKGLELIYLPMLGKCIGDELLGYMSGMNWVERTSNPENFRGVLPDVIVERVKGPCIVHYDSIHERFEIASFVGPAYDFPELYAHSIIYEYSASRKVSYVEDYLDFDSIKERPVDAQCESMPTAPRRTKNIIVKREAVFSRNLAEGCNEDEEIDEEGLQLDKENKRIIKKIRELMKKLRASGMSEEELRILLRPNQKLSRLRITSDYHFFLVDYDNKEVKMTPIQKSLLILYLRHPEGIAFKMLSDYQDELFKIYHEIDGWNHVRQHHRLENLCNPLRNTINENVSRIRNAFRAVIDDSIACAYYISGKQGQNMHITLDRDLVVWEE